MSCLSFSLNFFMCPKKLRSKRQEFPLPYPFHHALVFYINIHSVYFVSFFTICIILFLHLVYFSVFILFAFCLSLYTIGIKYQILNFKYSICNDKQLLNYTNSKSK